MPELVVFQKGFNYSQDGPGNRLVYHLSGCSLRCPWCSNPEGKKHAAGTVHDVEALLQEALSCKPMFFDGGGVTLTGGEVTEQFEGAFLLLRRLQEEGIRTCIETNGTNPRLPELFPYVDHLIMDIKHHDQKAHDRVIGGSYSTILQNIRAAARQRRQLALRIPLIGGFNASLEDAEAFASLLHRLAPSENVTLELLPYHEYGRSKYEKLGIPYPMSADAHISAETMERFSSVLQNNGIHLIHS